MEGGWSEEKQSFVQYYGGDAIDASALLISLTGFTAPSDPRMLKTLDRIQRELTHAPHVYRYRVDQAADDWLKGIEVTFSICSFWFIEALAREVWKWRGNTSSRCLPMPTTWVCIPRRLARPVERWETFRRPLPILL